MLFSDRLSLRQNFAWISIGNIVLLGSQWVMLMAIAKVGTPEMVGQYTFALAVVTPIIILGQMQHRQILITDTKCEFHFKDYLITRIILTVLSLIIIWFISILLGFPRSTEEILIITAIAKALESITDIYHAFFQKIERMDIIGISSIIRGVVSVVFFWLLLLKFRSLFWPLIGFTTVFLFVLILYDLPVFFKFYSEHKNYRWQFASFKKLFLISLPLAVSSALVTLSGNMPRYFLDFYYGKTAVGLFSVAVAPLIFLNIFQNSLGQTVLSRAAKNLQDGKIQDFEKLARKSTAIFFVTSLGFLFTFFFFGEELINLFFSPEYITGIPTLLIMTLAITLNSFALKGSLVIIGGRFFRFQLLIILLMVIVQVVANYWLIKPWGIFGAGLADFIRIIVPMFVYIIGGEIILQRFYRVSHN